MLDPQTSSATEYHLIAKSDNDSAIELLTNASKLSVQTIKQAMQKGCVWHSRGKHTQRLRRSKKALKAGDEIHMYYNAKVLSAHTADAILLADQQDYSVWYKPFGMLCQGSKWSDHTTINRFAETHLTPQRPAFIVHRLDRATTGVMVIAHSKSAARALSNAFEQRHTKKTYQAIVDGDFSACYNAQLTISSDVNGKPAVSHVSFIEYCPQRDRSKVQINIDTGRKHQIRVHLSSINFPIIGDRLYGEHTNDNDETNANDDLQLQAISLKFPDISNEQLMSYELPLEFRLSL